MINYAIVFLLLLAFELAYIQLAGRLCIVDRPHHQSSHKGVVIRGGGIVFFVAYLLWSIVFGFIEIEALIGLTIIAVVSFIDDIHSVDPRIRLLCQFMAIIMIFFHSGLIQKSEHVIFILSVASVGALNIYNFMDGVNGMTGGYSLVVLLAMLYVNMYEVPFFYTSPIVYVLLAIIVFNVFNFRKRAWCFAGDVGSLSIGFIVVYLLLRLALKGQSMSWIALLSVYLVDGGMTILHRVLLRENLMKPHKKHAYQIMANELKIPHLAVAGIYMGLQTICSVAYIMWPGYPSFFAIFGTLTVLYLAFMKKYYHLHVENHQ